MKEVARMRTGVLKTLKEVIRFFEDMERRVKRRDSASIYPAYTYLRVLTHHMREGDLTPLSIELAQELLHAEYVDDADKQDIWEA